MNIFLWGEFVGPYSSNTLIFTSLSSYFFLISSIYLIWKHIYIEYTPPTPTHVRGVSARLTSLTNRPVNFLCKPICHTISIKTLMRYKRWDELNHNLMNWVGLPGGLGQAIGGEAELLDSFNILIPMYTPTVFPFNAAGIDTSWIIKFLDIGYL